MPQVSKHSYSKCPKYQNAFTASVQSKKNKHIYIKCPKYQNTFTASVPCIKTHLQQVSRVSKHIYSKCPKYQNTSIASASSESWSLSLNTKHTEDKNVHWLFNTTWQSNMQICSYCHLCQCDEQLFYIKTIRESRSACNIPTLCGSPNEGEPKVYVDLPMKGNQKFMWISQWRGAKSLCGSPNEGEPNVYVDLPMKRNQKSQPQVLQVQKDVYSECPKNHLTSTPSTSPVSYTHLTLPTRRTV